MSWRKRLQENPGLATTAAIAFLLLAGGVLAYSLSGKSATPVDMTDEDVAPAQAWFFDAGSGELFPAAGHEAGPLAAPSKAEIEPGVPAGLKAAVFACRDCADSQDRFVAYVTMLPDVERVKPHFLRNDSKAVMASVEKGKPAKELNWVEQQSEEGHRLTNVIKDHCGGNAPKDCLP